MRLKIRENLRTASRNQKFTGSYKTKSRKKLLSQWSQILKFSTANKLLRHSKALCANVTKIDFSTNLCGGKHKFLIYQNVSF